MCQDAFAEVFMESDGRGAGVAGGIGDMQHVEVALEHAVFSRFTVDVDESEVEMDVPRQGEVVLVDILGAAIGGFVVPAVGFDNDFENPVQIAWDMFLNRFSAHDGDDAFFGVASADQGDVFLFHFFSVSTGHRFPGMPFLLSGFVCLLPG